MSEELSLALVGGNYSTTLLESSLWRLFHCLEDGRYYVQTRSTNSVPWFTESSCYSPYGTEVVAVGDTLGAGIVALAKAITEKEEVEDIIAKQVGDEDVLVRQVVDAGLLVTKWKRRSNGIYALYLGNLLVCLYHPSRIDKGFFAKVQTEVQTDRTPPVYFNTEEECIDYCEKRLRLFVETLQGVKQ